MKRQTASVVLLVLSVLGFLDALLVHQKIAQGSAECVVFKGCEKVLFSQYSTLWGVSLSWWGIGFYGLVIIASLWYGLSSKGNGKGLLQLLVGGGFLFSLYLLHLQINVIGELCTYCIGSFLVLLIAGYVVFSKKLENNRNPK
jgi:uncharacterized membrane protein